ncbi:MAG: hypothetical protein EAZ92_14245 [Candidatus Kapaibacterium sp.]|nr:MAG: hypothetical protein EAZ92_14245 [Candidatus Kapabacteria bacterium]
MSFSIAIPTHPLFAPLVANAERICAERGIRLLRGTERDCAEHLARHTVEATFISPMSYALIGLKTDLRIIPAPTLVLEGLTYSASVYLKPNAEEIRTCVSRTANDFIVQMGAIMLSEKFDIPLALRQESFADITEALRTADVVIEYGYDAAQEVVLDVSDEWTDFVEVPMPLGLWVCRPEEVPEDVVEIVYAFRDEAFPDMQEVFEQEQHGTNAGRTGSISLAWNDAIEEAVEGTMELLYYTQYVSGIAAVKIWQRDVVERV